VKEIPLHPLHIITVGIHEADCAARIVPINRLRIRGVLGRTVGLVELKHAPLFTRPGKIEKWEMRDSASWCYLILLFAPSGKIAVKKQHLFEAESPEILRD